jgi:hypothetical protein
MKYQSNLSAGTDLDDTLDVAEMRATERLDTAAPTAHDVRRYTMEDSKSAAQAGGRQIQRSLAGGLKSLFRMSLLIMLVFIVAQGLDYTIAGLPDTSIIVGSGLIGLTVSFVLMLRDNDTSLYTHIYLSVFASSILTLAGYGSTSSIVFLAPFLISYGIGTMLAMITHGITRVSNTKHAPINRLPANTNKD